MHPALVVPPAVAVAKTITRRALVRRRPAIGAPNGMAAATARTIAANNYWSPGNTLTQHTYMHTLTCTYAHTYAPFLTRR